MNARNITGSVHMAKRAKKDKKFYLGIDVGGTKISAALVASSGQILSRQKYSTLHGAKPAAIGRQLPVHAAT